LQVAAAVEDSAADLEAAVSVVATATVAAAVVVAVTVAETATVAEAMAAAVEVDSVVETAEAAGAEAVVAAEAVTTVIKMVTSHVNAPNKGKSATRSEPPPPGGTTPIYKGGGTPIGTPILSHSSQKLLRNLCNDQRGLLSLSYSATLLRNHSLSIHTTYYPSLPMYFCENFDHHMVYFMKYLSVHYASQPLFFHTTNLNVVIFV
jgi:hypothetical protein